MNERRFLTAKQIAGQLNITRQHLAAMAKRGQMPRGLRFGRCVRWDAAQIDNWLDGLQAQNMDNN